MHFCCDKKIAIVSSVSVQIQFCDVARKLNSNGPTLQLSLACLVMVCGLGIAESFEEVFFSFNFHVCFISTSS